MNLYFVPTLVFSSFPTFQKTVQLRLMDLRFSLTPVAPTATNPPWTGMTKAAKGRCLRLQVMAFFWKGFVFLVSVT